MRRARARSLRVSSASTRSTFSNTLRARVPISASLPIGNATTKSAPGVGSLATARTVTFNRGSGNPSRLHQPAIDRRRGLGRVERERVGAQAVAATEHQRVGADEERADRRGELVSLTIALEHYFDAAPQGEQRPVVVIAGHAEHARCPPRDLGVPGQLERLAVRRCDIRMTTAHE